MVSIPQQTSWLRSKLGEERVYSAYTSTLLFITKGSQDWNSSRSGSRSWCSGHGGMLLTGLLPLASSACSLIEPKSTSPGMAPPTRGPPPLITNWENALRLDLMEAFSQLKFFVITPVCVKLTHKTSQYNYVHRSLLCHSNNLETTQMSYDRRMDAENVVHLHNEPQWTYYSAIKNKDILSFAGKWMELENIILSEVTQTQKDMPGMYSLISG